VGRKEGGRDRTGEGAPNDLFRLNTHTYLPMVQEQIKTDIDKFLLEAIKQLSKL
jgi:hypothetical protein